MIARAMLFFISVMFAIPSATAQVVTLPDIDISGSSNGIVPFPENTPAV